MTKSNRPAAGDPLIGYRGWGAVAPGLAATTRHA
jgi:hypothetical protein